MNTMHFLTFAGKSSHDFGVHISGEASFNRPKRRFSEYDVTGRNGTLLIDEGCFENQILKYPSFIVQDMPDRFAEFINYLSSFAGYQRLEDTYAPDEFRLAQYSGGIDVTTSGYMNRSGEFELEFNCKPQRFLKAGEKVSSFTQSGAIMNKTRFESQPLLRIYGNTAGTVSIGDYIITISAINEYLDIDTDIMDAYKGATNMNEYVSFNSDNVGIKSGMIPVTFTGGITRVDITPRFFRI